MSCSICEATRNVYAHLRSLGKSISTAKVNEIAQRAAKCATPMEAKRLIDEEIARATSQKESA